LSSCGGSFNNRLDESKLGGEKVTGTAQPSPEASALIAQAQQYASAMSEEELMQSNLEDITRNEGIQVWKHSGKPVRIAQESEPLDNRSQRYEVWLKEGKPLMLTLSNKIGKTVESGKTWVFSAEGKCYDVATMLEADAIAALIASPFPNYVISQREQELDAVKKEMPSLKASMQLGARAYAKGNLTWLQWNEQGEAGPRTVYACSEQGRIHFWKIDAGDSKKYALTAFGHLFFGEWQENEGDKGKAFYLDLAENMGQLEFLQAHGAKK
jgi:hypothetical protein